MKKGTAEEGWGKVATLFLEIILIFCISIAHFIFYSVVLQHDISSNKTSIQWH